MRRGEEEKLNSYTGLLLQGINLKIEYLDLGGNNVEEDSVVRLLDDKKDVSHSRLATYA